LGWEGLKQTYGYEFNTPKWSQVLLLLIFNKKKAKEKIKKEKKEKRKQSKRNPRKAGILKVWVDLLSPRGQSCYGE